MHLCKLLSLLLFGVGVFLLGEPSAVTAGDKDKPKPQGELVVTDGNGKNHKVKTWKFTIGAKHLSWLVAAPKDEKEKEKTPDKGKKGGKVGPKTNPTVGPQALELHVGLGKVPIGRRILTYVLLENIRSIAFDAKKETMTVRVAKSDKQEDDEVLEAWTGYKNINVFTIDAEADLGEFGMAQMKFKGGVSGGIKAIQFPTPIPIVEVKGRFAEAIGTMNKDSHKVVDLQPLYRQANGLEHIVPTLFFQTTVKMDVGKIRRLAHVGVGGTTWDVTLKSGDSRPLELIERPSDATIGRLEGLVGRASVGYKLFPLEAVSDVYFDQGKKPEKKDI